MNQLKRRSWADSRIERLKEELATRGNTPEALAFLSDYHDLNDGEGTILAGQVVVPARKLLIKSYAKPIDKQVQGA